jgi:hypothetical protein
VYIYKLLLECVQRIRRHGPTTAELLAVTRILGEGYIYDLEIVPGARYDTLYYSLDENTLVFNRERRYIAWLNVCRQKFKLLEPVQREEE